MILISQILSSIIQLFVFTSIPFIWYIITNKKISGFLPWIGLTKSDNMPVKISVILFIIVALLITVPYLWLYNTNSITLSGLPYESYIQSGFSPETISVILLWAVVQTSLTEEIIFRGFLYKRLSYKLGDKWGNLIQAVIFGLIHSPSAFGQGLIKIALIVFITGTIGYILGYIVNKSKGSILCSWLFHASANIISPVLAFAFLVK